ncbi:hypothetical protein [Reyranella sp.]|uniref:hypothetical protein n=1 Tax=Reyranella sp. TaxID=1929291 RepID=UPI0012209264|nr:hypothetical protein [Reyranella sp.]TAJ89446.1 MAG: hypothetical protein EPO50_03510 [Reyranella sp.]
MRRSSLKFQHLTYKMNTETKDTPNVDWAAIEAGLEELKRRPNRLSTLIGPPGKTHRQQLRLTSVENAALKLINVTLAMLVGRGVSHALVHRLALSLLLDQCKASLADPAVATRLRAMLIKVREERRAEHA